MKGLEAKERARDGKEGGVRRLVYASSYVLKEGEALPGKRDLDTMRSYGDSFDEKVCLVSHRHWRSKKLVLFNIHGRLARSSSVKMPP